MNRLMRTCIFIQFSFICSINATAPKLMVFIVIDQFSAHYLPKIRPFLSGGLKLLDEEGISYVNAFYEQSMPATAPGHALLSTGTYGSFHGIINNIWYSPDGKKIHCDDDSAHCAAVFAPDGSLRPYGRSPKNLLADTFADQCILHSYPHASNDVWTISLKSRASIMLAGRLGKPLWFDRKTGAFTSSTAYFEALPEWVMNFNTEKNLTHTPSVTWRPFFDLSSQAYVFKEIHNYRYAAMASMVGQTFKIDPKDFNPLFSKTPTANKYLLDLALACIDERYTGKETDRLILYVSMSSLDKVGHSFGPHSMEALDLLYHTDYQLQEFIDTIYAKIPQEEVLFVLTADHGVPPIPEILEDQGFSLAQRLQYQTITDHLNQLLEKACCTPSLVQHIKGSQIYLNMKAFSALEDSVQQTLYTTIKGYLASIPGIRRVWTFDELIKESFAHYDIDRYMQRQLYKGRSGQIFYATRPYSILDAYTAGTSHSSQFAYDTHVPLIFYQKGARMKKRVTQNVSMDQVAVSLATLYEVPRPSAAAANVLPELPL